MKRANRLMLIAGVVLAAAAFVAVLAFGGVGQQRAPAAPDVSVVVAAVDLPLGTTLVAEQLSTVTLPATEATDTFANTEDLVGQVVRRSVAQGQTLTSADFQTDTSVPQVASSLASGLRAVAVPLSRVDSVGALLQPGDWVDVIVSLQDIDGLNPIVLQNPNGFQVGSDGTVSPPFYPIDDFVNNSSIKVVVQGVQVLAALPPEVTDGTTTDPSVVQPDVIAVLAVTPQQAEVIRFAQLDGNVSLALRSPADFGAGQVSTTGITLQELVETYGVLPPAPVTP